MYPGMKLLSTEFVLIPLRFFQVIHDQIFYYQFCFSIKIPDIAERLRRNRVGKTLASNLVYTIWAVFGGFILHFFLCNYLTVLLRPSYEEPVDTAAELIKRDITPFLPPGFEIYEQLFAASSDPNYQEISKTMVITKDWDEYDDMVRKVTSTGTFAEIGIFPAPWVVPEEEFKYWYRSSETIGGDNPYTFHLATKKWPLKKVL